MCTGHTVHIIKSRGVIRCYFLFSLDALLEKLKHLIAQELQHSSHMYRCSLANIGRVPPICGIDDIALRREVEHLAWIATAAESSTTTITSQTTT